MGVGEDRVCFDVEKEYVGEEDEVLWPHIPEERYGEKTDAREDGRQAEKGQTSNHLVPGFERMDQAGHGCCVTASDRSGKMAKKHQSQQRRLRHLTREKERERERERRGRIPSNGVTSNLIGPFTSVKSCPLIILTIIILRGTNIY